jgi:hypothetical protein
VSDGRIELLKDKETRWRPEQALERTEAREHASGEPFSRRAVNTRLRQGEHRVLMYQQGWRAQPGAGPS